MKQFFPRPMRRTLSRGRMYARRLMLWQRMARHLRGATDADQQILLRSLRAAPLDLARDLDIYRYPTLLDDATITVDGVSTFPVRAGSDDLAHIVPSFQASVFEAAKRFAAPGGIVIDAGANIGAMTVALSQLVGPGGHVLAVEMMPETAELLRRTINLNDLQNVKICQRALFDRSGDYVTAQVQHHLHGQASITRKDERDGLTSVSVETATLDEIAADFDEISFIKMDLEGAEPKALSGATETLRRTRALLVEVWYPETDPTPRILEEAGFDLTWRGLDVLAVRRAA